MKRISVVRPDYFMPGNINSPAFYRELICKGFEKIGVKVDSHYDNQHIACWGWKRGKAFLETNHQILVMERGYIGNRFEKTSLGWNGLNGYAEFDSYNEDNGERFYSHEGFIKPWKKDGDYIVIMGQVKNDASLQGKDISILYKEIAEKVRLHYNIPVYFRPHPDARRRGGYHSIVDIPNINGSLEQVLSNALFTISYNSNSCVDSIQNGVPCYAMDKGTMVWNLCMKDFKDLFYPDREKDLYQLAWKQWSKEELENGFALKKIADRIL